MKCTPDRPCHLVSRRLDKITLRQELGRGGGAAVVMEACLQDVPTRRPGAVSAVVASGLLMAAASVQAVMRCQPCFGPDRRGGIDVGSGSGSATHCCPSPVAAPHAALLPLQELLHPWSYAQRSPVSAKVGQLM